MTSGTIYWGNVTNAGVGPYRTKCVYVGRYRLTDQEETKYVLAIPTDGTGIRDEQVPLTGGDENDTTGVLTDHATLIAVHNLNGFRTMVPTKAGRILDFADWGPEMAPRLDALQRMADKTEKMPVTGKPEEFVLTDVAQETEADGADAYSPPATRIVREADFSPEPRSRVTALDLDAIATQLASKMALGQAERRTTNAFGEGPQSGITAKQIRELKQGLGPPPEAAGRHRANVVDDEGAKRRDATSSSDASERGRSKHRSKKKKKSKKRKVSSSSSSSSSQSSDKPRVSRGAGKMRQYEKLRKAFSRRPRSRWTFLEKAADDAGYSGSGSARVELYLNECTKLGKTKLTSYIASAVARIGQAAAAGESDLAAGLSGCLIGFLDQVWISGDVETSWRTTLLADPIVIQRQPTMTKAAGLPDGKSQGTLPTRMKFSAAVPMEVLESTLETARQWKSWDDLSKLS